MRVICPVSGTENEDREECRQCGTDLRPLIQFAEVPAEARAEGMACMASGQASAAVELLSVACALQPESADNHIALARALGMAGLEEPARMHLERAAALEPERADIAEAGATLREEIGKKADAAARERRRMRRLVGLLPVLALVAGVLLVVGVQKVAQRRQPQPDWVSVVQRRLDADPVSGRLHLKAGLQRGTIEIKGRIPGAVYRDLVLRIAGRDVKPRVDTSLLVTPAAPAPVTWRVRKGESWWRIARRAYGQGRLWPRLAKANHAAAGAALEPGEVVVLPPVTLQPRPAK